MSNYLAEQYRKEARQLWLKYAQEAAKAIKKELAPVFEMNPELRSVKFCGWLGGDYSGDLVCSFYFQEDPPKPDSYSMPNSEYLASLGHRTYETIERILKATDDDLAWLCGNMPGLGSAQVCIARDSVSCFIGEHAEVPYSDWCGTRNIDF